MPGPKNHMNSNGPLIIAMCAMVIIIVVWLAIFLPK